MHDSDFDELKARVDALERTVAELRLPGPVAAHVEPAPAPPAQPRQRLPEAAGTSGAPSRVARRPARDVESLVGSRGLLYVGAFLIVIGVASFLKIAFDRGWIGPPMRVAMGLIAAVALIAVGNGLRKRLHPYFADALIGLGAAIGYLSLYAAGAMFSLLPVAVVALGMIVVTGTACVLAYRDDRAPLAYFGTIGGFLTPLLLGSQTPNLIVLFTYLAVLATGATALGELRGWRALPLVALVGTTSYWIAFCMDPSVGSAAVYERMTIALVLYGLFATTAIVAWRSGKTLDGWRIALVAINAAWFFLGLSALAFDQRAPLAMAFLAVAAGHVAVGFYTKQRAQFWLATIALSFAIPPICYAFSPWVPQDVVVTAMHLAWIGEAVLIGVLAARWRDPAAIVLTSALLAAVVIHALVLYDQSSARVFFNERFISLIAAAAGTIVVRRVLAAANVLNARSWGWARIVADAIVVIAVSPEARHLGAILQPNSPDAGGNVALSIFWALYGGWLIVTGIRSKDAVVRWEGLALLGLTVLKVFAVDLTALDFVFRVVSALGLGIVLLALAYLYQRRLSVASQEDLS